MSTSRVRVYLACSLDGYVAGPGDDLSWLPAPEAAAAPSDGLDFDTFLRDVGCLLMGRRTHDVVAAMDAWPYGALPVLVPTHRELTPGAPTVRPTGGPITDLVAQARSLARGRDVYVDGADVVRQALDADLVDELILTVVPTLLTAGVALFDGLTRRSRWRFVDSRRFGGDMLQLTLRPRSRPA